MAFEEGTTKVPFSDYARTESRDSRKVMSPNDPPSVPGKLGDSMGHCNTRLNVL
jgi:hypothetical protein